MTISFAQAVLSLCPTVSWSMKGDDFENCSWGDPSIPKPSMDAIIAEQKRLQSLEDAKEQATATAKASALAKLTALGLTQAEITALIG